MDTPQDLTKKEQKVVKQEIKVQEKQNLEIRDTLAIDRTKLANERTLLAYLRTAIALVLAGLTFLKVFAQDSFYFGLGLVFIGCGLGVVLFGVYRFTKKKRKVSHYADAYTPTSPVHAQVAAQEKADSGH
jgi:putative membrane protein